MRANEEALRATNLDCLGRATKIHGDIFVSNAKGGECEAAVATVMRRVIPGSATKFLPNLSLNVIRYAARYAR